MIVSHIEWFALGIVFVGTLVLGYLVLPGVSADAFGVVEGEAMFIGSVSNESVTSNQYVYDSVLCRSLRVVSETRLDVNESINVSGSVFKGSFYVD